VRRRSSWLIGARPPGIPPAPTLPVVDQPVKQLLQLLVVALMTFARGLHVAVGSRSVQSIGCPASVAIWPRNGSEPAPPAAVALAEGMNGVELSVIVRQPRHEIITLQTAKAILVGEIAEHAGAGLSAHLPGDVLRRCTPPRA
jgi:hypothetical protein